MNTLPAIYRQPNDYHLVTAQELKAIKNADAIIAHYYITPAGEIDAYLDCILRAENSSNGFEQRVQVKCNAHLRRFSGEPPVNCTAHLDYNRCWETARDLLKAGDFIVLDFTAGNNSQNLDKNQLYRDDFVMTIVTLRPHSPRNRTRMFFLETSSCPDNTARMCRTFHL